MKFNEKLIELRKKQGLSQEELGYKLNVTRQTVSKWELGQTTPEMDKLVEIAKNFNVSVDDLINESDITNNQKKEIENQPINTNRTKNKKMIIDIFKVLLSASLSLLTYFVIDFVAIKILHQKISFLLLLCVCGLIYIFFIWISGHIRSLFSRNTYEEEA